MSKQAASRFLEVYRPYEIYVLESKPKDALDIAWHPYSSRFWDHPQPALNMAAVLTARHGDVRQYRVRQYVPNSVKP